MKNLPVSWTLKTINSQIFLFLFSERTEENLLSEGLLFPLDVIWQQDNRVNALKTNQVSMPDPPAVMSSIWKVDFPLKLQTFFS